jgi:hypothetical protein
MNTYCGVRSSRGVPIALQDAMGHELFSFGLLDVPRGVRLRRPYLREAPAGFGLGRLVTAFMNNPGCPAA